MPLEISTKYSAINLPELNCGRPCPETPFVLLLKADSEYPLPDDDTEVSSSLASYGAVFKKTKKAAPDRLELLAGLTWVNAHQSDLHVVWPAASEAQSTGVLARGLAEPSWATLRRRPPSSPRRTVISKLPSA